MDYLNGLRLWWSSPQGQWHPPQPDRADADTSVSQLFRFHQSCSPKRGISLSLISESHSGVVCLAVNFLNSTSSAFL
jgi:hypothetical protein